MKNQTFFLLILTLLYSMPFMAQEPVVKSMQYAADDNTATLEENVHIDNNGNKGGMVKVHVNADKVTFKDSYIFETRKHAEGEYWVFMAKNANKMTVYIEGFLPLAVNFRDYDCVVKSLATYDLTIEVPAVGKDGKVEAGKQFLSMSVAPANATVTIDGKPQQLTDGALSVYLGKGRHTYRVEAKGYATESGSVNIGKERKTLNVQLKADKGRLKVNFQPADAHVFIDDEKVSDTAIVVLEHNVGEHKVEIRRKGYKSAVKNVVIQLNKQSELSGMLEFLPSVDVKVGDQTIRLVPVQGGTFTMGTSHQQDAEAGDDELVPHQVTLSDFMIANTEVTLGLWHAIMGTIPNRHQKTAGKPVDMVSWEDCQKFIQELNKQTGLTFRLPTEAEWEYAARGGLWSEGTKFSGDRNSDLVGWCAGSTIDFQIVRSKKANELGIYDMTGNAREWCQDWYGPYSSEPQTNPQGPSSGSSHVSRGGGWMDKPAQSRVTSRHQSPYRNNYNQGFRLVLSKIITQADVPAKVNIPHGDLNVNFEPKGAQIYINRVLVGTTPMVFRNLAVGGYMVRIISEGYNTVVERIMVNENKQTDFKGSLEKSKQQASVAPPAATPSAATPQKIEKETFTVKGVAFNMVRVKGGTFKMGPVDEIEGDGMNEPVHQVTLSEYMIGETEVTQELWQAVMGRNPSKFKNPKNPVEQVTWFECMEFIEKLNKLTGKKFRLPTEAEWELAARGGVNTPHTHFAGSDNIEDVAWYYANSGEKQLTQVRSDKLVKSNKCQAHPVAQKKPNALGLYDMSGNVIEWCFDLYRDYDSESKVNPVVQDFGFFRILRGGGCTHDEKTCFITRRRCQRPAEKYYNIGLRLAM